MVFTEKAKIKFFNKLKIISVIFLLLFSGCIQKDKEILKCNSDRDCWNEESKCVDGFDPYNFCDNGTCKRRVFIRNPCLDHICPKGSWIRKDDNSCFTYKNCAKTGCDDNSDETIDECIGIGTRSEGCLYTIKRNLECSIDSDCVPGECCHSTTCVPKEKAPNCENVLCTYECREGTIDCGYGSCACINGTCMVLWNKQ